MRIAITSAPPPAPAIGYAQPAKDDRKKDGGQIKSLEEEFASKSSMSDSDRLRQGMFERNEADREACTASRAEERNSMELERTAALERRSPKTATDLRLRSPDPMQDSSFTNGLLAKFSSSGSPTSSLSSQQSTPPPFSESPSFTSHSASPAFNFAGQLESKTVALNSRVGLAELLLERERYHAALVSKDKPGDEIKGLGCGSVSETVMRQYTPPASGLDFGTGGKVRDALAKLDRVKSVAPIPLAVPSHQPIPRSRSTPAKKMIGVASSRRKTSRTKNELRNSEMDREATTSAFQPQPPVPSFSDLSPPSKTSFVSLPPSALPSSFPTLASPSTQPSTLYQTQLGLNDPIFSSFTAPYPPDPLLFGSTHPFTADEFTFSPPSHPPFSASHSTTSFPSDYSLGLPMELDPQLFGGEDSFIGDQLQDFALDEFLASLSTTDDSRSVTTQNAFDPLYWGDADSSR